MSPLKVELIYLWKGGDKHILNDLPHLVKILIEIVDGFKLQGKSSFRGRPFVYSVKAVTKAFLVMVFLKLNSVRSLARVLALNPLIAQACSLKDNPPSYRTLTRRFKTLESAVIEFAKQVIRVLVKYQVISLNIVSTDSSLLEAKGRKAHKGRSVKASDPDARWGWSSTRDWVFGYKIHLTSTVLIKAKKKTLLPLVWQVTPANRHDCNFLLPLMEQLKPLTQAGNKSRSINYSLADKGYDTQKNYQGCRELSFSLITPVRKMKNRFSRLIKLSKIKQKVLRFLKTKKGKKLYYRRADTERLIGHLKDLFLLNHLPVMKLINVKPYLALVNLAYLLAILYNHLNGRSLRAIKSLTV